MSAIILSKTGCPSCVKAKKFFSDNGIKVNERLYDDEDFRKSMYVRLSEELGKDIKSVPQIYYKNKYIGGYPELQKVAMDILDGDYD